jgi:site-specific DNA-methyltransferase (adenine-specific)
LRYKTNLKLSLKTAIAQSRETLVVGGLTITCEDNMELMARYPDKYFDLAIVDPPYGINMDSGLDGVSSNSKKGKTFNSNNKRFTKKEWDKETPNLEYFTELQRVSKNQIIWGGNYFTDKLPVSRGWIFWDKKITNRTSPNFSDGELAWTSFDCILRRYEYDWIGFGYLNNPQKEKKIHPTQKPVQLYSWLLQTYAKQGDKILDTHLGSGSIAIACHDYKFELTACELDEEYFEKAKQRIINHVAQQSLF